MRKWMRDRVKRRKKPGSAPETTPGQGTQAPLQPTFLDRTDNTSFAPEEAPEIRPGDGPQPVYESQPENEPSAEEQPASVPAGEARRGARRDRSRRRGRRGRGPKPGASEQQPSEPSPSSVFPVPGQATGEAAEVALDGSEAGEAPIKAPTPRGRKAGKPKPPKGAVVLAIGLPGSGKSSWFKRHSIIPLSSDLVRGLLFDDPTEQRFQDLVFSTLRAMLRARMLANRPFNYIDATNLSPKERHSWIKMAQDFGYEAHAVYFDVPTEICMERNHRRSRNVPEDVMQRMAQKLRPPKFEEGFAKITVVRLKRPGSAEPEPAIADAQTADDVESGDVEGNVSEE
jgi:predicted kinase